MNDGSVITLVMVAGLACALGYFFGRSKLSKTGQALALAQQRVSTLEDSHDKLQANAAAAKQQIDHLNGALSEKQQSFAAVEARYAAEQKKTAERTAELEQVRADLGKSRQKITAIQTENTELQTRQSEKEAHYKQQLEQFDEQKDEQKMALKTEFENLANRIFEARGRVFTDKNKTALDELLQPFKTQIQDFKQKVEDIHHKETRQQAELKTELKHLQALNQQITEEAHGLSTALKGQHKMQGNWGEMILENVLDRSGLIKDQDYKREVTIRGEDGRGRPDVIVYLPDHKHLIIDAKVSLNAYTRYVNAEHEAEREQALAEHVSAVSERIKELSRRKYPDLPGLNSPDMVFMFIPIESAFVEAMKADEQVFQRALGMNVLVATPTTLLTSLNIVRQLWRFEDQNKHTAELAKRARKIYDKLRNFVGSMENLGAALERAKTSYDSAYGQLTSGRGNLIKQANEFRQIGVLVDTELPRHLVEKAELELPLAQLEDHAEQSIDQPASPEDPDPHRA